MWNQIFNKSFKRESLKRVEVRDIVLFRIISVARFFFLVHICVRRRYFEICMVY